MSISLTMDVEPMSESESESPLTLTLGRPPFWLPSRAMLKRQAFVRAVLRPPSNSRLREEYVWRRGRVHFGPRTYRIPGVVDRRLTTRCGLPCRADMLPSQQIQFEPIFYSLNLSLAHE